MSDLIHSLPDHLQEKLERKPQPDWVSPMLATLTEDYFSHPDWIFERKLDGARCLVYKKDGKVRLGSRNRKNLGTKYPELLDALESNRTADYIADGEIVTFKDGITSFSRLQPRIQTKEPSAELIRETPVYLYLFDLLHWSGYDLADVPLRKRKALLKEAINFDDPIRFVRHRNENGLDYYREACKKGWEGIIAKAADSNYVHTRSRNWLKFKCVAQQELVIGGYTEPKGERIGFGALLVGYYENENLQYAGKVGTGFDDELLGKLHARMQKLEQDNSPFAMEVVEKNVHWIKPELVGEIAFTEWTSGNKLRHPRFLGLRKDKDPKKIVKEKPD